MRVCARTFVCVRSKDICEYLYAHAYARVRQTQILL